MSRYGSAHPSIESPGDALRLNRLLDRLGEIDEVDWSVEPITVGEYVHVATCICDACMAKVAGWQPSAEELADIARMDDEDRRERQAREAASRVSAGLRAWRAKHFPPKESAV